MQTQGTVNQTSEAEELSVAATNSGTDKQEDLICGLQPPVYRDLEESFRIIDQTNDGSLNAAKVYAAANNITRNNPTEAEIQDMIGQNDINGDGTISFDEYLQIMRPVIKHPSTDDDIDNAFAAFDRDGNGLIDLDDLTQMMQLMGVSLSERDLTNMISSAEGNKGEGEINIQDFKQLMSEEHETETDNLLQECGFNKENKRLFPTPS